MSGNAWPMTNLLAVQLCHFVYIPTMVKACEGLNAILVVDDFGLIYSLTQAWNFSYHFIRTSTIKSITAKLSTLVKFLKMNLFLC